MSRRKVGVWITVFLSMQLVLLGNEKITVSQDEQEFNINNIKTESDSNSFPFSKSFSGVSSNFRIYNSWDFESEDFGSYTSDEIRADFPVVSLNDHGSGSIANDVINGQATKVLKVTHLANQLTYGFDCEVQIDEYDEIYLSYNFKFDNEFNSTEGGKLPGLEGFPIIKALQYPATEEGFSALLMFRRGGSLISYNYDRTFGYVPWVTGTYLYDTVYINNGQWYNLTQRLKMNTFTNGVANGDGICEIWVDGRMIFKVTNRKFMAIESPTMKIDGMHIANWYGGYRNSGYEPLKESYTYFDNFKIWVNPDDPTLGTFNTHDGNEILSTPAEITDKTVYYDQLITNAGTLSNNEYGASYSSCIDEAYLIDAGSGKTVTYSLNNYTIGTGDFLFFYNGNTSDAKLIRIIKGLNSGNNQTITSTGRYLFIRFSADTDAGEAGWTGNVSFSNANNPDPIPVVPASPSGLTATKIDFNKVIINWTDNSSNETHFEIERSGPNNNTIKRQITLLAGITSYTDTDVQSNSTYEYRIRARNAAGYSSYSNTIQVNSLSFVNIPAAPSLLKSQEITEKSISIQWNDNSANENGFIVKRALALNPADVISIPVGANETSFVDSNLIPSTTYVYTVQAINQAGNSSLSNKNVASTLSVAETKRIKDGLIAYYNFNYDPDNLVRDLSGFKEPLNLSILNPASVSWDKTHKLIIKSGTILTSVTPAIKITEAIKQRQQLTVECWIKPAEPAMSQTSRIISLGSNDSDVGFVMNQNYSSENDNHALNYSTRLSTESTNQSGFPEFFNDNDISYINLQHLVYVRDSLGAERLYVNGKKQAEGFRPSGFDGWKNSFYLRLGNENDLSLPWQGYFYSVAFYNKALSVNEITTNYSVGPTDSLTHNGLDFQINVYPNPITDQATIEISPNEQQIIVPQTVIKIFDIYGKVIYEKILFNPNSQYASEIDLKNYTKGIYFLQVISGDQQKTTKLIKL